MVSKSIAVLLVGLCVLQATNASVISDVISNMNKEINKTIADIEVKMASAQNAAAGVASQFQSQINAAVSSAAASLNATVQKAKDLGVDVSTCTQTGQNEINKALNSSKSATDACASASNASLDTSKLQNTAKAAQDLGVQSEQKLSKCGLLGIACQTKIVADVGIKSAELIAAAAKEGVELAAKIPTSAAAYAKCAGEQVTSTIAGIQAAARDEEQCLQAVIAKGTGTSETSSESSE